MENVADFKEIVDAIKANGGDAFKLCFQCGLCDMVCPWNRVRIFSMRKIVREAAFGMTDIESEDIWRCTTCGRCPQQCPRDVKQIEVRGRLAQDCHGIRSVSHGCPSDPCRARKPHAAKATP